MQSLSSIVLLIFGFNANLSAAETPLGMASAIDWVKPEGANVEPIFAQARQSNKTVFSLLGCGVVSALQSNQSGSILPP
jgi:hypothetical protein